jgi:hypothetical protein
MFAILPLIILVYRYKRFSTLTHLDLPLIEEVDMQKMKHFSKIALVVFIVFTVLSFVPYGTNTTIVNAANRWSLAITVVGLFIAGIFDFRAEGIKKRGMSKTAYETENKDNVRWYHVLIALFIPYVGIPWGIVNICRKRRRSGITMVIIGGIILLATLIPIISSFLISLVRSFISAPKIFISGI